MRGAIPLLPNTPSWRGAQLKNGQLYLYLLPCLVALINDVQNINVFVLQPLAHCELGLVLVAPDALSVFIPFP
jgi:hypothetical protein